MPLIYILLQVVFSVMSQDMDFLSLAEKALSSPSPALIKVKEDVTKSISESPRFPVPGTYISYEGKNNAFKWLTTIKENGTFAATVTYEKKSASGDGQWKVESGRVYIRWKTMPEGLESVPGAPEWVDITNSIKNNNLINK